MAQRRPYRPRGLRGSFPVEWLEARYLLSAAPSGWDVALIDRTLPQSRMLINAALGNTRVITYDGAHDSPQNVLDRVIQLSDAGGIRIASLSIFSHGAAGRFELGNDFITAGNSGETASQWMELRHVFAAGATLQIYGCDTADGISGRKLLNRLSQYTGATAFGSTNITGYGGDWVLEAHSNGLLNSVTVHAPLDVSELSGYRGQLVWIGATSGNTNDSSHDYNNTANWAGGTIDDSFSGVTFTGNTTLYFSANRTTGASGLNLNYSGAVDLTLMSNSSTARTLTLGGTGITGDFGGSSNSQTVTFGDATNAVNMNLNAGTQTFTVTGAGDSLVVPNVISNGTLTKAGSGTLQLSGTNTFSNTLTVSAGTLTQSGGSASPTTFSISSGATLNVNGGTLTITSSPTISGTLSIGGGTLSSSAGITNAGTINISSGTLQMTGTGPSGDYHNSGGATTNMTGGLLELGHDYAATTLNATGGTVEFQTSPGIANMKNGPYQFCNLQIDTGVTVPFNNAVLTVDIAGNFTNNGSATWGNSTAVFNGSGAQTIGGSSSTTFHNFTLNTSSATNTVTMASGLTTTVSATTTLTRGTLLVDGTFSPSANLTVPANVTVGGEGTITTSKSISVTGGSIAPGDPTGTLTTGPLTFSSGSPSYSVLLADSSGTITTDKQSVTGTATLGTSLTTLNLSFASGFSPLVGDQFTILSATTSRTGTFTNAATTITASGETFSVTYSATSVVLTYQSSSATTLAFGQQPANSTAGSAISPAVTVDVQDGFGNTKTSDSSTVTLTLSGGTFEGGTTTVTAAAANGVATFSNLKIDAAGTYRLTATDGSLTSAISSSFTVSAAAASAYRIAATSATPTAGASDQLTLTLVDQFGNTVTSFSGDKPLTFSGLSTSATGNVPTVTSKTGSATNEGTSELITFTNGVSSAGGTLVAYKAQSATLSVTDGTLTSASTGGTGVSLTVSAAAANAYRITAASTTPIAGAGDQLTLTLVDQYGNTVTSFSGDKTLTFSGLGTSTGGNVPTVTSKTGGAINEGTSELITFTNGVSSAGGSLIACKAETATLAVTDGTLGSGSTAGTGVSLTVSPAPVNSFGVTAPASATEGASFSFTVTALDPFGNTVTGYSGTVSFSSSDAQASLPGNHTFTTGAGNDNGVHTFSATLNTEGSKSITVTDGSSITGSVSISVGDAALTDASTSASVATNEGSSTGTLTVAQFSDANPGDHTADFSATIHWGDGNNSAGTVSYNSGTGTYSVTGSHTYTDEHATYAVTVDVADAGGSTLTGIGKMTVSVADVAPVVAVDQASVTVPENATATNTGTWSDYDDTVSLSASYGTVVKNINGTWSWSANGDESNSQTVTMTATNGDGATAVTSFRLTFTDVAPTVATPASATPNPVAGISTNLLVLGADDEGEGSLTYTWAASSKPAGSNPGFSINGSNAARDSTVTFDKAGSYTFQVTITNAGGLSVTSSISVTVNQTLTSIALSPPSATLNENATQQFAATAFDQFGAALATQPSFTWSIAGGIGSVDSSGLYTAPGSAGSATVRATSGSIHADALVTISNATPSVATAASATPNPVTGTTTGLRVLGADDGGEANLTYTWSLTGTPPASVDFSDNGTNSAKNSTATFSAAGTYDFLVTITDAGGLSTTSSLSVTVDQTQTDIAISPSSVTLNENETQQFTATAQDQFGDPMASQPSFTWSIASGIGSIDSSGLYTSPGSTGSATVHADSGGRRAERRCGRNRRQRHSHCRHARQRNAQSCHGHNNRFVRTWRRRRRRAQPYLHMGHHRNAARRCFVQRQRRQLGKELHGHVRQGRYLPLPGHNRGRPKPVRDQQRYRDRGPDFHGDRGEPRLGFAERKRHAAFYRCRQRPVRQCLARAAGLHLVSRQRHRLDQQQRSLHGARRNRQRRRGGHQQRDQWNCRRDRQQRHAHRRDRGVSNSKSCRRHHQRSERPGR